MMVRVHKFEFKRTSKSQGQGRAAESGSHPTRLVWQLAFAHRVGREIADGLHANRAAAARHYGITRARMTQLLDLLLLPCEMQEAILGLRGNGHKPPASERAARALFSGSVSSSSAIREPSTVQARQDR